MGTLVSTTLRAPRPSRRLSRASTSPPVRGVESLPGTLKEAIDAMEADALVCETLGSHVTTQYVEGKRREWDAYRTHVSDWEIGKYLVTY